MIRRIDIGQDGTIWFGTWRRVRSITSGIVRLPADRVEEAERVGWERVNTQQAPGYVLMVRA